MVSASVARAFEAKVTVVHVVSGPQNSRGSWPAPFVAEYAGESIISKAQSLYARKGLKVRSDLITHRDPASAILYLAKEGWHDLIVMGNGGDDRWEDDSVGQVAMAVARRFSRSIMVVKKRFGLSRPWVLINGEDDWPLLELAIQLVGPFAKTLGVLVLELAGKGDADAMLRSCLQRAADVGIAPTGAIVKGGMEEINEAVRLDGATTLVLRKPRAGFLWRILRSDEWIYDLLRRCPSSTLLLAPASIHRGE